MKHVFVGDIHGKIEMVRKALDKDGHIVFVGDFMDSFDRSPQDHENCIVEVLEAIMYGKATALYGNHELSYMASPKHLCSGYSQAGREIINAHFEDITKHFKFFYKPVPDFLVTHAGLTAQIAKLFNIDKVNLLNLKNPAHWIGQARKGPDPIGGIFWCDFNEEFQPIQGLNQIFGHTRYGGDSIRKIEIQNSINYCIDCLDKKEEFLELDF